MAEPKPHMPTAQSHLSHLPPLGTKVDVDARTMTPRDTEKEAAQATMVAPEWIKPEIQIPSELRTNAQAAQRQAPRHTFSLDPQPFPEAEPDQAYDQEQEQGQDAPAEPVAFSYPPQGFTPTGLYTPQTPGYVQEYQGAHEQAQDQEQVPQRVPAALQHAAQVQAQAQAPQRALPRHTAQQPRYQDQPAMTPPPTFTEQPMYKMQAPMPAQQFHAQPAASETAAAMHAVRPSQFVPPPTMGTSARTVELPGKPLQHPVVAELLRDFGLRQSDIHEFASLGFTFKIREVNAEVLNYCLGNAAKASVGELDMSNRTRLMVAAMSVISINDVPVTEIFPWQKAKLKGRKFDPWWPPYPVQVLLAEPLFRFFFEEIRVDVVSAIADEYDSVYGNDTDEDTTKQPLVVANEKLVRFKCSVAGCKHTIDVEPTFTGRGNEIHAVFCVHHGVPMTPLGYVKDLADLPLE